MKRMAFILIGSILFSLTQISGQKNTAAEYWRMEQDSLYKKLVERQTAGETLSEQEQTTLAGYKARLSKYFEGLPDEEKSLYYKYRAKWASDSGRAYNVPPGPETNVFSGERSMYTQYLIASGLFGAFYGGAAIAVLGLEDDEGLVAGIPLLTAGASVLLPIITLKDKFVSYNSLSLAIHGKAMGAAQGLALGALLIGEEVDDGKLLLAISTASSIGMGRLGYSLGKNKPWTEGRAGLYSYYGTIMPLEGLALIGALNVEDIRIIGLTSLISGAGGYLIADRIADHHDYTIGDINATGTRRHKCTFRLPDPIRSGRRFRRFRSFAYSDTCCRSAWRHYCGSSSYQRYKIVSPAGPKYCTGCSRRRSYRSGNGDTIHP